MIYQLDATNMEKVLINEKCIKTSFSKNKISQFLWDCILLILYFDGYNQVNNFKLYNSKEEI